MPSFRVWTEEREVCLVEARRAPPEGEALELDEGLACALVRAILFEREGARALRSMLASEVLGVARLDDDEVAEAVRVRLARGDWRAVALPARRPLTMASGSSEASEDEPPAETSEDAWIEVTIVEDGTGKAVAQAKLKMTTTTREERALLTDGSGTARVDGIPPGRCSVTSPLAGARLEASYEFVGTGPVLDPVPGPDEGEVAPGPYHVCRIVRYAVRTDETLEGVAEQFGKSKDELAMFNFGTAAPAEVDKHLRHQLGCTREDDAGQIVFDVRDRPGVLYVPMPWSAASLVTERIHELRVRRLEPKLSIRLDDPVLGFLGELDAEVKYADGSSETLKTDELGVLELEIDRWSDEGNYADVKIETELREHEMRVFLVLSHADTERGAWQRLVNLGHVDDTDGLPPPQPPDADAFAAALEEFQASAGLRLSGELDAATVTALEAHVMSSRPWGTRPRDEGTVDEEQYQAKDAVA